MKYLARRCALFVPTLLLVLCLVFLLVRLIPGDVVTLLLNDQNVSAGTASLNALASPWVCRNNILIGGAFPSLYPASQLYPVNTAAVGP